jgi:hypothetical protein
MEDNNLEQRSPTETPTGIQVWPVDKLVFYVGSSRWNDAIRCQARSGGGVDRTLRPKASRSLGVTDRGLGPKDAEIVGHRLGLIGRKTTFEGRGRIFESVDRDRLRSAA